MESSPPTKSNNRKILICVLLLFIIFLYGVDLFELSTDEWNILSALPNTQHLPQITILSSNEFKLLQKPYGKLINSTHHLILAHVDNNTNKSNSTIHALPTSSSFNKLFKSSDDVIYGNPLQFDECRNAIIDNENVDIEQLIKLNGNVVYRKQEKQSMLNNINNIIWTRELIDSLNRSIKYGHLIRVRVTYDPNNHKNIQSRQRAPNEPLHVYSLQSREANKKLIVYYHISKCASSSIHNMLTKYYNTTRMYWPDLINYERFPALPDIDCGFTFIRHPIDRLISGYFTVLSMLDREFNHESGGNETLKNEIKIEYGKKHPWFDETDSKIRFKLFVLDLCENKYEYIHQDKLLLHVASQTGSVLGNFHEWKIDYLGRMEFFAKHWNILTNEHEKCSNAFKSNLISEYNDKDYKLDHSMKRRDPKNKEKKNKTKISDELNAFIEDEQLYNKAVEYYYQDFVCFGYNMTHKAFLKHVDDKEYI